MFGGIVSVIWGFVESLWTTLWVDGTSAPLTGRVTTFIWKSMQGVFGKRNHKLLSLSGPVILIATISFWIVMIIIGWSLIFYTATDAIQNPTTKSYPDFVGRLWYITYVMFSVGNGDFTPQGNAWQLLSAVVAFGGMALVTLAVTYILQVLSAVTVKRSFASQVTSIAKSPEEFVVTQWTGNDFGDIELQLSHLSTTLSNLSEKHMAYPILHYYHAAKSEKANAVALAILDDALMAIKYGVPEEYHPSGTILKSTRSTVQTFLNTLSGAYIEPSNDTPPVPDLSFIKKCGVPTVAEEEFRKKFEEKKQRRKTVYGYLRNSAWKWPVVQ
ncbi:potassium channel family protein [Pontibacter actiniarum]|nr:potassium channel family protein [Pontibacter actiniarum]